jgi:hypothetical protein
MRGRQSIAVLTEDDITLPSTLNPTWAKMARKAITYFGGFRVSRPAMASECHADITDLDWTQHDHDWVYNSNDTNNTESKPGSQQQSKSNHDMTTAPHDDATSKYHSVEPIFELDCKSRVLLCRQAKVRSSRLCNHFTGGSRHFCIIPTNHLTLRLDFTCIDSSKQSCSRKCS